MLCQGAMTVVMYATLILQHPRSNNTDTGPVLFSTTQTDVMKKWIIFCSIAALLGIAACSTLKHLVFYEEYNQSVTIPAQAIYGATDSFLSPLMPTTTAQQAQANNTELNLITSVKLYQLRLTITSPSGHTFAGLESARIYIQTDSLPPVEIAHKYNISTTSDTLNMDVDDTELKPYLTADNIRTKIVSSNNQIISQPMTVNAYMKFRVEANLFKAL
jgi:hypothetical protein